MCTCIVTFIILSRMSGALLGVLALFSGFFSEMVVLSAVAPIYAYWQVMHVTLNGARSFITWSCGLI